MQMAIYLLVPKQLIQYSSSNQILSGLILTLYDRIHKGSV